MTGQTSQKGCFCRGSYLFHGLCCPGLCWEKGLVVVFMIDSRNWSPLPHTLYLIHILCHIQRSFAVLVLFNHACRLQRDKAEAEICDTVLVLTKPKPVTTHHHIIPPKPCPILPPRAQESAAITSRGVQGKKQLGHASFCCGTKNNRAPV